ncbi:hypothetical protein FRC10_011419 [Ceratobasidium sp. 414]|nr:hypothetical protein FRC10_011419 [Ceratobasidium sp. 414]
MYGVRVDGNDGPRRSTNVVATYKIQEKHHSPTWIEERADILTEVIPTDNLRSSNYVHHGWSIAAATTLTPWIASRIARGGQANPSGQWTTKRTAIQRLALDIPPEDLILAPKFEAAIRIALGKPTTLEKFQALDKVFQLWGDVLPVVFELGALLAISDTDPNFARGTDSSLLKAVVYRLKIQTGRFVDVSDRESQYQAKTLSAGMLTPPPQGGDMSVRPDNIIDWLSGGGMSFPH